MFTEEFITSPEFFLVEYNRISPTHRKIVSSMFSNLISVKELIKNFPLEKKKFQGSLEIFIKM